MSGQLASGLAGRLRAFVMLERRDPARDAIGGAAGDWVEVGDRWVSIEPMGAGPAVAGEALSTARRWRVTLRAGSGVEVGDRIVWPGAPLRVRGVLDDPAWPDRTFAETEEER